MRRISVALALLIFSAMVDFPRRKKSLASNGILLMMGVVLFMPILIKSRKTK